MALPKDRAWFPAKQYGYGWGLPRRWQGWVVVLVYFAGLLGGQPFAQYHVGGFLAYAFGLTALLVAICIWKGEAARWRWGND